MTTPAFVLCLLVLFLLGSSACGEPEEEAAPVPGGTLTDAQVTRFASVALAGITREYPNKPGNVLTGPASLRSPRAMHPAFYGCFDWHSAVHGHWTLVRLLRLHPGWTAKRKEVVAAVGANLTAANLEAEAAYFEEKANRSFERTYGWAWLLRLAQELRGFDDDLGGRGRATCGPSKRRSWS